MMKKTFAAALLALILPMALAAAEWQTLRDCKLLPSEYNDGDSFHVSSGGKEFIFRLYFVDTPESENSLPERVAQQATHFGITPERSIEIGRYAKQATAQLLSRPFTVLTKFQDALGRSRLPRYYAFITTSDKEDLAEVLVGSGLARSFGTATAPPGETSESLRSHYDGLQDSARRKKLGAWGTGGPIKRAETSRPAATTPRLAQSPTPGVDDATTGEILADLDPLSRRPLMPPSIPSSTPSARPQPSAAAAPDSGKISLNSASNAQIQSLPGIGPTLAARIIAARPYNAVEELRGVKGIGAEKLAAIESLVAP